MERPLFESRKTVQEIEPLFVDVILAASFEWRDLANHLVSAGRSLPCADRGFLKMPQIVYRMAGKACSIDSDFSRRITTFLDYLHHRVIERAGKMELPELCVLVQEISVRKRSSAAGLLWALATNEKESVRKIARVLLQRITTEIFSAYYFPSEAAVQDLSGPAGS